MTRPPTFSLTDPLPAGSVAIEASAGTGKTYTLAGLVVRYVAEAAVRIDEILIVTFTRAAAAELRDRVRTRLTEAVAALRGASDAPIDDDLLAMLAAEDREGRCRRLEQAVADFDTSTISTIHGFAQSVLTTLGSAAPGDLDATLIDDTDEIVAAACADILSAESVANSETTDQLPTQSSLHMLAAKVLGNPGIEVVPGPSEEDSTPSAARVRRLVDRVVEEVHRRRRASGTLSFDDVLTQLRDALIGGDAAAATLKRRFRVALIDEFQDTDPVQWAVFSHLFGAEGSALVLVADPKQAIYAFRGANVHTYLQAAHRKGTGRATLATSWRSDGALLSALGELLAGATFGDPRIEFVPVVPAPDHRDRRLTTDTGDVLPALCVRAALGDDLPRTTLGQIETDGAANAIARDLADQVHDLLRTALIPVRGEPPHPRRVRPGDVAVLVAAHRQALPIRAALARHGIPAVVRRGDSVLRSAAAMQWRRMLAALARPSDPTRARTAALSWFLGWSVAQVDAATDAELSAVQEQLVDWAEILESHGTAELCARLWSDSGVVARVLALPDGDRDVTDLDQMAGLLQAGTAGRRPTAAVLLATLDSLAARGPTDPEDDVTARRVESESEAVQIMTVHVAKGLEFPIVCVPTLWRVQGSKSAGVVFQDPDSDRRTIDVANGADWPTKAEAERRRRLADNEILGENLRLLYVALTRAQHQTLVWWSRAKGSDGTGLARVLFAREAGRIDPVVFSMPKIPLPADDSVKSILDLALGAAGDAAEVTVIGGSSAPLSPWIDDATSPATGPLQTAVFDRVLARSHRRWSFSAISDRAGAADLDPDDESLGDAAAADEPPGTPELDTAGATGSSSELPLGRIPGGAQFGTLVHRVFEQIDLADDDLDTALTASIIDGLRWNPWPVEAGALATGLRAAIDTPLGPLFQGRRLRDLGRVDRLGEMTFDLRLGEATRHATDRDLGALVLRHLAVDDPVRPWAQQAAAGIFDVELAGHLTGSIDAVFRVREPRDLAAPPRFVVVDYKTNKLTPRDCDPQPADYAPDRLAAAMAEHHYPLQALLYSVALHRYLRWRLRDYEPFVHLGGAAYLFVRGMHGPATPTANGNPFGVFAWNVPPALVTDLSDLLDGREVAT